MSTPDGRRTNGLHSADWGALVDVDPRLAESLLERLATAGVAAFVEPAEPPDTITRVGQRPNRPLDRLWVDPRRADEARAVVSAEVADLGALLAEQEPGASAHGLVLPVPTHGARRVLTPPELPSLPRTLPGPPRRAPESMDADTDRAGSDRAGSDRAGSDRAGSDRAGSDRAGADRVGADRAGAGTGTDGGGTADPRSERPLDDDEAFARIVAGLEQESASGSSAPWPASEDLPKERARRRADRDVTPSPSPSPSPSDDPTRGDLPAYLEPEALPDDGHYVPPPPPPVGKLKPRTLGAAVIGLLGLILLFVPRVLGFRSGVQTGMVGVLLLVAGAGLLVWWMRDAPPTDSGPDDGAVV